MAVKPNSVALVNIKKRLNQFLDDTLKNRVDVVLPKNLSKEYLLAHTPTGISGDKWLSVTYHLVQSICLKTLDKRFKDNTRSADGWVSLSSTVLREVGARAYKDIRVHLVKIGVIECDNKFDYKTGETLGYRLGKEYRGQYLRYRTITDEGVKESILEYQKKRLEKAKPRILKLAHLARWVTDGKLVLDKTQAREYVERYEQIMTRNLDELDLNAKERREALVFVRNRYTRSLRQVERFGKDITLTVDSKGGRLYSPIVTLMSPLRNFLTYDGQPLVSFDIKNSQPMHFVLMLAKDFWKENSRSRRTLKDLDETLWRMIREDYDRQEEIPLTNLHGYDYSVDNKSVVKSRFAALALTGKLYEFNSAEFRGKHFTSDGRDRFDTREKAKVEMLKLMYFDPRNKYSPAQATFQEFARLFPHEARVMELLKKRSYKDFSVLLQKLEAQILLHDICRKLYDFDMSIPLFTVHDSIITTTKHSATVRQTVLSTYEKLLGTPPALEETELTPTSAYWGLEKYLQHKLGEAFDFGAEGKSVDVKLADVVDKLSENYDPDSTFAGELPDLLPFVTLPLSERASAQQVPNPFEIPRRKLKK